MKIAYSREAMYELLALPARKRGEAIEAAMAIAGQGDDIASDARFADLMPIAEGGSYRLAPFSGSGDLVVTRTGDTLVVVALCDVLGSLKEANEQ